MSVITFITSKAQKAREVAVILEDAVDHLSIKGLEEIQSFDLRAIVVAKARAAFDRHGAPVIVEDVALHLAALGGFPGPFVKFWEQGPTYNHAVKIAVALQEFGASAKCGAGYCDAERFLYTEGNVHGHIVPKRGVSDFGFDPYFEVDGTGETFAEMGLEAKNRCSHRFHAFIGMRDLLRKERIL